MAGHGRDLRRGMKPRFVVYECYGSLPSPAGYIVTDTHVLHRTIQEFAQENGGSQHRRRAEALADRLNAEYESYESGVVIGRPTRWTERGGIKSVRRFT